MAKRTTTGIYQNLKRIWAKDSKGNKERLKNRLIKQATGSFGLKMTATGLGLLTSVILARCLGVEKFGIYGYAIAWLGLLGIPATMGLQLLLIRDISAYNTQSAWGLLRGLLRWSNLIVLLSSVSLAVVSIILTTIWLPDSSAQMKWAMCIAFVSLPITSLITLRLAAMKGLNRVLLGELPESLIAPTLLLLFTGGLYLFLGDNLNASWVLVGKIVAISITFIYGGWLLKQNLPQSVFEATPEYQSREWFFSALPLMVFSSIRIIYTRTDIIMLGVLQGAEAVGIYMVVSRLTKLITLILNSSNGVISPIISSLYSQGDLPKLQRLITRNAQIITLISLVITLFITTFGYWLLLIFGTEFTQGINTLIILSCGKLFNACTGPVGWLLNMTGHEKFTTTTITSSACLNLLLNFLLIPRWGIEGAAIATATSMIVVNVVNSIWVYNKLGINSTAFGFLESNY